MAAVLSMCEKTVVLRTIPSIRWLEQNFNYTQK